MPFSTNNKSPSVAVGGGSVNGKLHERRAGALVAVPAVRPSIQKFPLRTKTKPSANANVNTKSTPTVTAAIAAAGTVTVKAKSSANANASASGQKDTEKTKAPFAPLSTIPKTPDLNDATHKAISRTFQILGDTSAAESVQPAFFSHARQKQKPETEKKRPDQVISASNQKPKAKSDRVGVISQKASIKVSKAPTPSPTPKPKPSTPPEQKQGQAGAGVRSRVQFTIQPQPTQAPPEPPTDADEEPEPASPSTAAARTMALAKANYLKAAAEGPSSRFGSKATGARSKSKMTQLQLKKPSVKAKANPKSKVGEKRPPTAKRADKYFVLTPNKFRSNPSAPSTQPHHRPASPPPVTIKYKNPNAANLLSPLARRSEVEVQKQLTPFCVTCKKNPTTGSGGPDSTSIAQFTATLQRLRMKITNVKLRETAVTELDAKIEARAQDLKDLETMVEGPEGAAASRARASVARSRAKEILLAQIAETEAALQKFAALECYARSGVGVPQRLRLQPVAALEELRGSEQLQNNECLEETLILFFELLKLCEGSMHEDWFDEAFVTKVGELDAELGKRLGVGVEPPLPLEVATPPEAFHQAHGCRTAVPVKGEPSTSTEPDACLEFEACPCPIEELETSSLPRARNSKPRPIPQ